MPVAGAAHLLLLDRFGNLARVAGVHVGVDARAGPGELGHEALVDLEGLAHLLVGDVVEEDAVAHGADGDGGAELAVAGPEDGRGGLLEDGRVELGVVHGEARAGEEAQEAGVIRAGEEAAEVGEGGRVGHVDGDGVAVAEGRVGDEFVEGGPAVKGWGLVDEGGKGISGEKRLTCGRRR